ncbi:hypothetical protein [Dactylosporangium sp. NPDC050588]|uniref:hypothetical protein n=1 Tax=Dactylosporangium sp. NPDC050588 TaxID=3157211 RepID=UPI0033CD8BEE
MSKKVLAFVPQHTTTKSRVMAIVDKGNGQEIDAVATVDWPHDAVAICNILNASSRGLEQFSGLWASLPASVRASLDQANEQRVGPDDERDFLASWFITELDPPKLPDPRAPIDWAALFPTAGCPADGCDLCDGCAGHAERPGERPPVNQCAPGGSCACQTDVLADDEEPCACMFTVVGPRWAAALYQSLAEAADALVEHAEELMWGVQGPASSFPQSLIAQPPQFFLRLAQACADLCDELAHGRPPVPHTIAELLMLDEAARSYLDGWVGGDGLDLDGMKTEMSYLPEAPGDFEMDALWMFQITDADWIEIAESETVYAPYSMNRVFDLLPEAKDWPRTSTERVDRAG